MSALGTAGKVTKQGDGWVACCPSHEDTRHSLSIGTGRDGRALLTCHAGCSLESIVSALRLTQQDLFPPSEAKKPADSITDIYEYRDESGRIVYEVCRYFPKNFRQRVPQQGGGYTWKMDGVPRIWFRLPELLSGLKGGKVCFICEGEKDANALAALGLTATSLAGGAAFTSSKHFPSVAIEHFRNAKVVLLPDNDEPGRQHMARIAERLAPIASWVRTVALPGVAEKGDVSDWLDGGGTVAALKDLVAGVAVAVTPASVPDEAPPEDHGDGDDRPFEGADATAYPRTHFGNRDRFVDRMRDSMRYVAALKQWYRWDGQRFAPDETLAADREAQAVIRSLRDEAAAVVNETQRSYLFKWAAKCATAGAVDQILTLAKSDPALARSPNDFDRDLDALNVQNGVIDLRTGILRPHRRADDCTKLAPVTYDPTAACPKWEAFLRRVVPDATVRDMLRIAVGYSLTGHIREECLFLLWGTGRNGKGTFFETLRLVAGDYAVQSEFDTFLESGAPAGGGTARGDLARLQGSRFVTTSEAGEGKRMNEAMLKAITGGDTITARQLYAKEVEFKPQFTLWMAANHRPVIKGGDDGIWSRMRLVPFTVRIPDEEIDRTLKDALRAELPGILAWAVSGAISWYRDGLPIPDAVKAATGSYREESDVLGEFIEDRCTVDATAKCQASDVYKAYKQWVSARGDSEVSSTAFGRKLTDRGFSVVKIGGLKYRVGLSVTTKEELSL